MKIISCSIELYPESANGPEALLTLDSSPDWEEMRYEERNGTYRAEDEQGFVEFYHWGGQPDRGFGGHHFHIKMVDGSEKVLMGPWSSNSESVSQVFFDRKPVTEAVLVYPGRPWTYHDAKGREKISHPAPSRVAGAVTVDLIAKEMGWPLGMTWNQYQIHLWTMKARYYQQAGLEDSAAAKNAAQAVKNYTEFGSRWGQRSESYKRFCNALSK